jgi:hypothetical protein
MAARPPKAVTQTGMVRGQKAFAERRGKNEIQKPRSARPIQLKANIEQAIAATEARVVTALTKRMTRILFARTAGICSTICPQ